MRIASGHAPSRRLAPRDAQHEALRTDPAPKARRVVAGQGGPPDDARPRQALAYGEPAIPTQPRKEKAA